MMAYALITGGITALVLIVWLAVEFYLMRRDDKGYPGYTANDRKRQERLRDQSW